MITPMHPPFDPSSMPFDPAVMASLLLALLLILIVYYTFMVRAILQMLRAGAHTVLLVFAFLSLVPFPLILIVGIMVLIIWSRHKRDLLAAR